MNDKNILLEINRFREIIGLPLIVEAPNPIKWGMTSSDEALDILRKNDPNFKGALDDISTIMDKNIDEIDDPILKEFRKSIDNYASSKGRSWKQVVANQAERKIVENQLAAIIKNSADLERKVLNSFYNANPNVGQFVKAENFSKYADDYIEKGGKDIAELERRLIKQVDSFQYPEIIKKDIRKAISSEMSNYAEGGKNIFRDKLKEFYETKSKSIIEKAKNNAQMAGKSFKDEEIVGKEITEMLSKGSSEEDIIKYISDNFGLTPAQMNAKLIEFAKMFGAGAVAVAEKGIGPFITYTLKQTTKIGWKPVAVGSLIYGIFYLFNESQESNSLKQWEDNLNVVNSMSQTAKERFADLFPYTEFRNPANKGTKQYIDTVQYKGVNSSDEFPEGMIKVTFGDKSETILYSTDDIIWDEKKPAPNNSTATTTKQNVIDAIIGQGYTKPITLNPDEDPKSGVKTVYTYTDAEGDGGTATVDEAGKITVV